MHPSQKTAWQAGEGFQLEGGVPAKAGNPPTGTHSSSAGISGAFASLLSYFLQSSLNKVALWSPVQVLALLTFLSVNSHHGFPSAAESKKCIPFLQDMPSSNGVANPEPEQPQSRIGAV